MMNESGFPTFSVMSKSRITVDNPEIEVRFFPSDSMIQSAGERVFQRGDLERACERSESLKRVMWRAC